MLGEDEDFVAGEGVDEMLALLESGQKLPPLVVRQTVANPRTAFNILHVSVTEYNHTFTFYNYVLRVLRLWMSGKRRVVAENPNAV